MCTLVPKIVQQSCFFKMRHIPDCKNNGYLKVVCLHILLILLGWLPTSYVSAQDSLIDSLNQQAYQLYRQDVSAAKSLAYQAAELAKEQELIPQLVDSYINLGRCFRLTNQWDSAYLVLESAIEMGEEAAYGLGLMNATNNLGICYRVQGKIEQAKSWFIRTLAIAQQNRE